MSFQPLLDKQGRFGRYVAGPMILLAWRTGLLSPLRGARLLVKGKLSYAVLQQLATSPTGRDRARMADLLCHLPRLLANRPLSFQFSQRLLYLLDNITSTLVPQRDVCLNQMGAHNPELVARLLDSVTDTNGFPLIAPLVMARLSSAEQDPSKLEQFQQQLFMQLRAHLRLNPQWGKKFREHLFIQSSLVFTSCVAPALQSMLDRLDAPTDRNTIRLIIYCRYRLKQAQKLVEEKGVSGRTWTESFHLFMEWSQAYLYRARLLSRAPPSLGIAFEGVPRKL